MLVQEFASLIDAWMVGFIVLVSSLGESKSGSVVYFEGREQERKFHKKYLLSFHFHSSMGVIDCKR